jgi:hypothetical protein
MTDYKALSNMSIQELTQLLSCVNQDIQSIKRKERAAKKAAVNNTLSELAECNIIAQRFTNKQYDKPVQNGKIKADIQIQKDILDYLNNGGHIITSNTTGRLTSAPLKGARAGIRLYRRFAV